MRVDECISGRGRGGWGGRIPEHPNEFRETGEVSGKKSSNQGPKGRVNREPIGCRVDAGWMQGGGRVKGEGRVNQEGSGVNKAFGRIRG